MAITRFVDPDSTPGGDGTTNALSGANRAYASLAEWEAARQAVLADVEECICESNGGSHTPDPGEVIIDGWTTTASFYIDIKTSAGARHAGVWDATKFRVEQHFIGNIHAFRLMEEFVRFTGIQFDLVSVNGVDPPQMHVFNLGNGAVPATVEIDRCIFRATNANTEVGIRFDTNATNRSCIRNSVFYGFAHTAIQNNFLQVSGNLIANVTIHGCGVGINDGASRLECRNVLVQDCTTCYSGPFDTSANNASDDGTQPGSSGQNGEATFIDETTTKNFHLAVSDAVARNNGADLSGHANFPFAIDIDGAARVVPWDIGADEEATLPPQDFANYIRSVPLRPYAFGPGIAR